MRQTQGYYVIINLIFCKTAAKYVICERFILDTLVKYLLQHYKPNAKETYLLLHRIPGVMNSFFVVIGNSQLHVGAKEGLRLRSHPIQNTLITLFVKNTFYRIAELLTNVDMNSRRILRY